MVAVASLECDVHFEIYGSISNKIYDKAGSSLGRGYIHVNQDRRCIFATQIG